MPGEEETIRLIDLPANKADIAELMAEIRKLDEAAKNVSGINIFGKTSNAGEARQQQQQMAAGMEQIAQLQAKMIDLENQLQAAKAKGSAGGKAKTDEDIRAQIEAAEARRQHTAVIKDQIKYENAEMDSLTRLRIELKKAKAEYADVGPQRQATEAGQKMLEQIQQLNQQVSKQEQGMGVFTRNVGNYSGALKQLEEEFKKVTTAMSAMEAKGGGVQNFGARTVVQGFGANQHQNSGPTALAGGMGPGQVSVLNEDAAAYQKLGQQAQWLNTIIQKQEMGFSSVTQQIRTSERALVSMRAAGLEGTEAFEALRMETTGAARDMKEFGRQQKLLESELPALKALTLAAKGLAGAYAIGSGAVNLFAANDEKLQEKMNKMIAVMTILQGLEEAWTFVNQAGAIAIEFKTAAMNAGAAATELYTFVTEGATTATVALNAAMVASVIGAVAIALGGMIYLLTKATVNTEELQKAQTKLNETMKGYYDALIKSNQALGEELEKQDEIGKKTAEVQAINVRSIKDQQDLSALKKQNAEADRKRADEELADLEDKIGVNNELQGQYDEINRRIARFQENSTKLAHHAEFLKSRGHSTGEQDDAIKMNDDQIKVYQSQADAIKVKLDRYKELNKQQEDADQSLKLLNAEDEKFAHELYERKVKALTEIGNLLRQQSADYLALQTGSGLPEGMQMKALNAEKVLREQIINSTRDQELRAENLTKDERQLIREKANKELLDLEIDFTGREAVIRYDARQVDINDANMTQAELLKMREKFYQQQEEQAKNAADNRKSYLETQRDAELKGLLETHEVKNPTGKQGNELIKYNERKLEIETDYNNKILRADEDLNRKQIALNMVKLKDLQAKSPGTDDQKKQQQKDIDALNTQNNALGAKNGNIELQIEQNTANKKRQIAEDTAKKKQEIIKQAVKYEQEAQEVVMAFVDAGYEREINRIDREIKKNNELKETESARIQNSTLSETQRAAAMERLAIQTDQRNTALQRKANQIKAREAEADRDAAVLKIFGNTLIDASAAGWITPAAIAIEVLGTAQIAALLAKSIPKYETGIDFSPEGIAMVHPGEMRIDPSGKISMTPDAPSMTYLDRGTKIIPKHKTDMMNEILLASIFNDGRPAQDNRLQDKIDDLKMTMVQTSRDQVAAIKKQKGSETHIHVDSTFLTYIKTCL